MENNVDDHGFIHPEFMQCVTATGRLSSRNPNFQNMPRGSTFAIRKVVESRFDDGYIMEGDYSQLEFRVAGFLAKDKVVYDDVRNGTDVHAYTASIIGCTRQEAKAHTFKPLYGGTTGTEDQKRYYNDFKDKYADIATWHESYRLMLCGIVRYLCRLVGSTLSQTHGGPTGARQQTAPPFATILFRGLPLQTYSSGSGVLTEGH